MTDSDKQGLIAALMTPIFLGIGPILGKIALVEGSDPFTVAALRMVLVMVFLWGGYTLFWRQYMFIYWAGFLACAAIGFTNGVGSLFYYNGLQLLDASVAQLINATYIIFVVILTRMGGDHVPFWTKVRVIVAFGGALLITGALTGNSTWLGIGFMTGNALLFAGTMVMSQRILYEMPAQTVTLYVMTTMAIVVIVARFISNPSLDSSLNLESGGAIVGLAITTALSRLTLFMGVKGVGSVRTALIAIAESGVALSLAFILLDERFTGLQWAGVLAMVVSLFLPTHGTTQTNQGESEYVRLPNVAGLRFQRMAGVESKISTQEMEKLVALMVGPTHDLDGKQSDDLRRLLGEEGFRKLQELEARYIEGKTQTH